MEKYVVGVYEQGQWLVVLDHFTKTFRFFESMEEAETIALEIRKAFPTAQALTTVEQPVSDPEEK